MPHLKLLSWQISKTVKFTRLTMQLTYVYLTVGLWGSRADGLFALKIPRSFDTLLKQAGQNNRTKEGQRYQRPVFESDSTRAGQSHPSLQ